MYPEFLTACRELQRYGLTMIDRAVIVPDASALLRLYECTPEERRHYLEAFNRVRNRIWVANRTREEVLRRKRMVRTRNRIVIPHVGTALESLIEGLPKAIQRRGDISPAYNVAAVIRQALREADLHDQIIERVLLSEETSFVEVEALLDEILRDCCVGRPLESEDLGRVLRTGVNRLLAGVPPGYADLAKLERRSLNDALGDLLFWEETLFFASRGRRPIIVITTEEKGDWWIRKLGAVEPHPAMIEEMKRRGNQDFGCLRLDDFACVMAFKEEAAAWTNFETLRRRVAFGTVSHAAQPVFAIRGGSLDWQTGLVFTKSLGFMSPGIAAMADHLAIANDYAKGLGFTPPSVAAMAARLGIANDYAKSLGFTSPSIAAMADRLAIANDYAKGLGPMSPSIASMAARLEIANDYAKGLGFTPASVAAMAARLGIANDYERTFAITALPDRNARRRARRKMARRMGSCTRCLKNPAQVRSDGQVMATCLDCRAKCFKL